ncbi:MAG: flagellar export chaperone FliS [Mariprofundaceae bacterium]
MTGYQKYRGVQVEGASPLGLVLLTYDALIKSLALAKMAADTNDMAAEAHHLSRALEALMELATSLNMEAGGKIATSLASLYAYMSRRILEGQGADISAAIDEVLSLASSLRDSWQELADAETGRGKLRQVAG